MAYLWLENEYRPVIEMLRAADLIGTTTETEAYMRVSAARYRLLRTHRWDEDVLAAVIDELSHKNRRRPQDRRHRALSGTRLSATRHRSRGASCPRRRPAARPR